ncbi:MAG: DUF4136 domain-containing protein, partial [Polyangiaceae bacterium]|nr:DUF4136 domain-containing protein [Polyangiaceae bacterium]
TPPVEASSVYDHSVQFVDYKTFAMLLPDKPVATNNTKIDPFFAKRLRELTHAAVSARGLQAVDKKDAQIWVNVLANTSQHVDDLGADWGYGPGAGFWGGADVWEEGTIVVDFIDAKTNQAIWRGKAIRQLDRKPTEKGLQEVLGAILAKYPPTE